MKKQKQIQFSALFSQAWFLPSLILVLETIVMTPMVLVLKFEEGYGWFHFAVLISNIATALTSSICAFIGMLIFNTTRSWPWTMMAVLLTLILSVVLSRYFIFLYFTYDS